MIWMKKKRAVLAAAALLSWSALAMAQTAPAAKSGKPATPATASNAAPMPRTDRLPMADFKKAYASGDAVVVDVRSAGMYMAGHIPGALSIPEETINPALAEKLKRMGKPVFTYCS